MQRNFLQSALSVLLGTLVAGVTAGQIQAAPASSLPLPIRVPPGFTAQVFANITAPTNMRFDSAGRLWVTALDSTDVLSLPNGGVYMMQDTNGDGQADVQTTFASGLRVPLGLEFQGTSILVSVRGKILKLTDTNGDGAADSYQVLIDHLFSRNGSSTDNDPYLAIHQNNSIVFGQDGKLYIGNASSCASCIEAYPKRGAILRFNPDGTIPSDNPFYGGNPLDDSVWANGSRNPYGLAVDAQGRLFATENGKGGVSQTEPPDELNLIVKGANYGWPYCWTGGSDPGADCSGQTNAILTFPAHSAPTGLSFYYSSVGFPAQYQGNAFVGLSFSGNELDGTPTPPSVVRVIPSKTPSTLLTRETFATGFELPTTTAVGPDGALYVSDLAAGLIIRIAYTK